ncbi:transglycosylase SLT domain-containing protein [Microvirga massiliensis]|uniref:transglycosylase SLT domain-containing protein n=1 Tax=Microvirga massiliensis TaxID=1033741 RepID=UPI00069C199D|nr:transglycosylase SLT domain-containing protein [Microvirga massiliensis]
MKDSYRAFKARLTEEACLEQIMLLRFGGLELDCLVCGRRSRFKQVLKRRAYSCENCGHAAYPCLGTPFEKLRTPLADWFFAISLRAQKPRDVAKELERQAGLPRATAERLRQDLVAFAEKGGAFVGWLDAIALSISPKQAAPSTDSSSALTIVRLDAKPSAEPVRKSPSSTPTPDNPAASVGHSRLTLVAAGVLGAGLALGSVFLVLRPHESPPQSVEDSFAPTLSVTAPRPRLTLAAVEEDLAAAKAAVEAVTAADDKEPAPAQPVSPAPSPGLPAPPPGPRIAPKGDPNDIIAFGQIRVRRHLVETVVRASRVVGADPTLLMAVADKESSFKTEVKAKTSSATGLFQFIERTWLGVLYEFGAKYGLDREVKAILRVGNQFTVPDPEERARILDLRREPYLSALMAGEMLKRDTLRIEKRIGRYLTGGEIYLVHFLGPAGAQAFIDRVEGNPELAAAEILPAPAEANKSIFYDKDGARSVAEIHKIFEEMISTRLNRYQEVRRITPAAISSQ